MTTTDRHTEHDALLIAGLAASDLSDGDRARAGELVASCGDCENLLAELRAIARATAQLPPAIRPRDFRLTEADAARIRPNGWRRLVAAFGSPRLTFASPLASGLASLGVAAILAGSFILPSTSAPTGAGAPAAAAPAAGAGNAERQELLTESASTYDYDPSPSPAIDAASRPTTDRYSGWTAAPNPLAGTGSQSGVSISPANEAVASPPMAAAPPKADDSASPGSAAAAGPVDNDGGDGLLSTAEAATVPSEDRSPIVGGGVVLLLAGIGLFVLRRMGLRLSR